MGMFAIKLYEFGGEDDYFVCEDERLWEWLTVSNYIARDIPEHLPGHLRVPAPEGYVFYDDMLVPLDSAIGRNTAGPNLSYLSNAWMPGKMHVLAPDGCIFYGDKMVSVESSIVKNAMKTELMSWGYVSAKSPEDDKGNLLILSPYHFLMPLELDGFNALGLSEERVFNITV